MNGKQNLFFLGYGFVIWLLATIGLKFVGLDEHLMGLNYALLIVGIPPLIIAAYRWQGIRGVDKYKASALCALPGMVLDSFLVLFYPTFFSPANFPLMPAQGHWLGAWLLFAYALTLLTAYVSERLGRTPAASAR